MLDRTDAEQRIHDLIDEILRQKRSGRTWGKITLEVTFQDGRPLIGRVVDETTFKFDGQRDDRHPNYTPPPVGPERN